MVVVKLPAVVDNQIGAPSVRPLVFTPRRTPNVVTKPSAPSAITSEVTPKVFDDVVSVSASESVIVGLCP